jgi:multicomponent Na+:H+ antiporter subunit C
METIIIFLTGFLFTCGFYLMLRRNITRLLVGVLFLSQAANLIILVLPGLGSGVSPIIQEGQMVPPPGYPDPLPQALILTAIVIGFGVIAFALVLLKNAYRDLGTDDLDSLKNTDA